jgi:type IV secretion system protein VirB8
MTRSAELAGYFEEANAWDADRAARARRSARLAWGIAGVGWLAALMGLGTLMLLVPLKRVEPFLIRVDNSTGVVDTVPVYQGGTDVAESVTRYLLMHYVSVCERFNFSTAESDYEECGAFHTAQRNQAWYAAWNPANPESPLNINKDGSSVRAQVKSVSFFRRANGIGDLAQVRYLKARRAAAAADEQVTHWIATIQYAYAKPSMDPKTRRWNPLGFKIVDFKPEPEVLSETSGNPSASRTGNAR